MLLMHMNFYFFPLSNKSTISRKKTIPIFLSIIFLVLDLTGHELVQEGLLNLGILLPLRVLLSGLAGPLGVEDLLISLAKLGSLLATKREGIVRLVPGIRTNKTYSNS